MRTELLKEEDLAPGTAFVFDINERANMEHKVLPAIRTELGLKRNDLYNQLNERAANADTIITAFQSCIQAMRIGQDTGDTIDWLVEYEQIGGLKALRTMLRASGLAKRDPMSTVLSHTSESERTALRDESVYYGYVHEGTKAISIPYSDKDHDLDTSRAGSLWMLSHPYRPSYCAQIEQSDGLMILVRVCTTVRPSIQKIMTNQLVGGDEYLQSAFRAQTHFQPLEKNAPSLHELDMEANTTQIGDEHIHPHNRIIMVKQGSGTLEIGDTMQCDKQSIDLRPGVVVHLPACCWHRFSTGPEGLTVLPTHPVTPGIGNADHDHAISKGTLKTTGDITKHLQEVATTMPPSVST